MTSPSPEIEHSTLTAKTVDRDFPLQEPGGVAETIKAILANGDIEGAQFLFDSLHKADETTVIQVGSEILDNLDVNPRELDPIRALRLGIEAGMQIGRQEGANVVDAIVNRIEEGE